MLNFKNYLIVANGPFLPKSIISEAAQQAYIIALDGAANTLARLGIMPHIILGDFDSIQDDIAMAHTWGITECFHEITDDQPFPYTKAYPGHHGVTLLPTKDQTLTDFQKSLQFAIHYAHHYGFPKAKSIQVVCATGGRIDHEQANIRALQSEYQRHCPIYLHNEHQTLTYISNQTITIQGNHNDHCGLFGMPSASITVKNAGLAYGGNGPYELFSSHDSSSNRLRGNNGAVIDIIGDALIVHPPMLQAQRLFCQKSRHEQLMMLQEESIHNKIE